jgi:hypothetical protein
MIIPINLLKIYKLDWMKTAENENTFKILMEHLEYLMEYKFSHMRFDFEKFMYEKDIKKRILNLSKLLISFPKLMEYIEEYLLKRNYYQSYSNKQLIIYLEYNKMRKRCSIYKEELIQKALHPSRIQKILDLDLEIEDLDDYI